MDFQPEFYLHIIGGQAGDAAPMLARLALALDDDAQTYPFSVRDLKMIGQFSRASGTQGLNEFYAMECARAAVLRRFKPWRLDQMKQLSKMAELPLPEILAKRFPIDQAG